jgi:hypothetical protein
MPISLPSFPTRRLVLLRFTRGAPAGDPLPDAPDIDERGYRAPFEGPMASLAAGTTVQVGLRRFLLETRTPLFVESSDPSVVRIVDPASGALPNDDSMTIRFTGVDGGTDRRRWRKTSAFTLRKETASYIRSYEKTVHGGQLENVQDARGNICLLREVPAAGRTR